MGLSSQNGWKARGVTYVLGLALMVACEPDATGPIRVIRGSGSPVSIRMSEPALELGEGETAQLSVEFADSAGNPVEVPASAIVWHSSDTSVARVDSDGTVYALKEGETQLSASYNGLYAMIRAFVQSIPVRLHLVGGNGQEAAPGERLPQDVVVRVENLLGEPLAGVDVAFSVLEGGGSIEPKSVATNAKGEARAVWRLGPVAGSQRAQARLVGRSLTSSTSVAITATAVADQAPPDHDGGDGEIVRVALNAPTRTFNSIGQTVQYSATAYDEDGKPVADAKLTWSSSNTGVATVDALGRVTAKAVGTAVITVAAACCADAAEITVQQVPAKVVVSPKTASAPVGGSVQFTAVVQDSGGTVIPGATVTWTSSNEAVARVDSAGRVSITAEGKATIRAALNDLSDTADVTGTPSGTGLGAPEVTLSVSPGSTEAHVTAQWKLATSAPINGWHVMGRVNGQTLVETDVPASEQSASSSLPLTSSPQTVEVCVQAIAGTTGPVGCASATVPARQDDPGSGPGPGTGPIPPPSGDLRLNEPSGFTMYAEHTMNGIPSPSSPGTLGAGARWLSPENANRMQVVPSTAPAGGPSALRVMWPQGLQGGTYPHTFTLQHKPSREVYVSMFVRFLGARSGNDFSCRFENHTVQTKWFYWMYQGSGTGHLGGRTTDADWAPNPVVTSKFWLSWQWTDGVATQETVPVHFDWNVCQWYHLEMRLRSSDPGQSNGRVQIWVNGVLVTDRAMQTTRAGDSGPSMYETFTWRPVWGGTGGVKTRDDYAEIAYIYVSGR